MDAFDPRDPVPLTLTVTDAAGAPLAPATIELSFIQPGGAVLGPVAGIANPTPGTYTYELPAGSLEGAWIARWITTGPGAGEQEYSFVIRPAGSALPYAATVEGVRARVLDVAKPTGAAPVGGAARPARVPETRIVEWILEGGSRVARKLRLLTSIGAGEADPVRLEYRAAARGLTELYAAALLWDATYPQAAKGDRYGAVLYDRFEKGLAGLAADLAVDFEAQPGVVDGGLPGDAGDASFGGRGAAAIFPVKDPRISRHHPW